MRAILLLLLILAAVVFASFYRSALRPYWDERLPRVMSHLGEGDFREAASAMLDDEGDAPPPEMSVTTGPREGASADTLDRAEPSAETAGSDTTAAAAWAGPEH